MIKEKYRPNLIGHWDFRTGSYIDQNGNYNASIGGTPLWVYTHKGRGLKMDGSTDYLDVGNAVSSAKTIVIRLQADDITANTDYIIDLNGTDYLTIVNGTVTVNGFGGASTTVYVNGNPTAALNNVTDVFHIVVTSDTGFAASDVDIGRLQGTGFFAGVLVETILYDNEFSGQDVSSLFEESEQEINLTSVPETVHVDGENLSVQSQQFDESEWGAVRCSISANSTAAPDGTTTADTFVEDGTAASTHSISDSRDVVEGKKYVWSCHFKPANRDWVCMNFQATSNQPIVYFDVANGTIGTANNVTSANMESVGDGWYRCWVTWTALFTQSAATKVLSADSDGGNTYDGLSQDSHYMWGMQLENRSGSPSQYKETRSLLLPGGKTVLHNNGSGEAWNQTFADQTAGILSNTGFQISSGTWRTRMQNLSGGASDEKAIENRGAGIIWKDSIQAYGSWEFYVFKWGGSDMDIMFIADTKGGAAATGQNGYGIRFDSDETIALVESVNGTPTDLISSGTLSTQTWYKVTVTRDAVGAFELFIDDSSIGTATDNTTTTGKYLAIDLAVSDEVGNFIFKPLEF